MRESEKISLAIHDLLLKVYHTISLPTHASLEKTFYFSLALLGSSLISEILRFYTFISWQGCLLCVILLITLLFIERRENDALLKMYRSAKLHTEAIVRRAKTASASWNNKRFGDANTNQHQRDDREQ